MADKADHATDGERRFRLARNRIKTRWREWHHLIDADQERIERIGHSFITPADHFDLWTHMLERELESLEGDVADLRYTIAHRKAERARRETIEKLRLRSMDPSSTPNERAVAARLLERKLARAS